MSLRPSSPTAKTLPLKMVGGSLFGRYPKISMEQSWNMIVSDNWLVPYAGYAVVAYISQTSQGRGIYVSNKFQHVIAAIGNGIYLFDANLSPQRIASIATQSGDVYFAENNNNQIAITDLKNIYVFDYGADTFTIASINFTPAYISFQDGYFIAATSNNLSGQAQWRLSAFNNGNSWPDAANNDGALQSKPTNCLAVVPVPGQGGSLFVFGSTVTESWYDTGAQLFPYQRSNFFNVDYGCFNQATIANLENIIVWLAGNEKAGPFIMFSNGGQPQKISTDGIDFKLASLTTPTDAYGFLFRQDGHMIYQLTFPTDNLSLAYDFNTQLFLNASDQNMAHHIARRVVYFNNKYYFVSFNDGNLYELNSQITTYDSGKFYPDGLTPILYEIPRIRICPTIRLPTSEQFITQQLNFPIENGVSPPVYYPRTVTAITDSPMPPIVETIPRVDMSVSIDGGYQFSSYASYDMNAFGNRLNRMVFWNLGWSNEFVSQFRFASMGRIIVGNGEVSIYQ